MSYVLDLTTLEQPTLDLTMPNGVKVRVTIPETDTVKEYLDAEMHMTGLLASGTKEGIDAAYDLVARLLSSNMEGLTFTGAELMSKYRLNFYAIKAVYTEYIRFIHGIEKN